MKNRIKYYLAERRAAQLNLPCGSFTDWRDRVDGLARQGILRLIAQLWANRGR